MPKELPKHFEPAAVEEKIYLHWLTSGAFHVAPDERERRYVIMMPLPNVTGALHMGHAMDNVMQDLLIRWHRMMGDNTLWMPGTDHAGIATQAVVEKRLFELEGKTRHDIGREALVGRIWSWKDEYQERIIKQLQTIGCSCDWDRQRFTMDAVCRVAVREAFFRLFRDGLIYRGNRLVNWDCRLQTAVSDDEIVYETVQSHFWHIRYPIIDPKPGEPEYVVVATTRPETMLGDTAVACHPNPAGALEELKNNLQERITRASKKEKLELEAELLRVEERLVSHLPILLKFAEMASEGRKVLLPLMEREIPLIHDGWAKPELGSGCVKITPGHDPNDYDVWQRHRDEIEIISILNPDGTLSEAAKDYAGLDRMEAREKILTDLEAQDLLDEIEDREIEIGHSDRSKTPIEPLLSRQWFVRMGDVDSGVVMGRGTAKEHRAPGLAQAAIDAIDDNWQSPTGLRLRFHPDHQRYGGTYRSWLAEKRDWCISRQLWWGHRIPIWYGAFEAADLQRIIETLPDQSNDDLHVWIADNEGETIGIEQVGEFSSDGKFELQVCLRSEQAEQVLAAKLEALGLSHDPDVLDTWFSSALWPFSTLGWPDPESARVDDGQAPTKAVDGFPNCLEYYYPGSCLITGRDIITLWVARMVITGLYNLGDLPFTACFVHANIQDGKGERMSKSKGNGIDPVDIIERYGADAMRYVLCDMQTGTQDIRLPVQAISPFTGNLVELATAQHGRTVFTYICPETGKEFDVLGTMTDLPLAKIISERFETGRAFCTKLWNAARFALMNLHEEEFSPVAVEQLADEDRWILSRLSKAIAKVTRHLEEYNPSAAIGAAREFFWSEFCDWYLEFIKPRFREEEEAAVARTVLSLVLDRVLRLFHPFVPFITEELWQQLNSLRPVRGLDEAIEVPDLIISAPWPEPWPEWEEPELEKDISTIQDVIRAIRDLRAGHDVPPSKKLEAIINAEGSAAERIFRYDNLVKHMAGLSSLEISASAKRPALAATKVLADFEIYLSGVLDVEKEKDRFSKQLEKLKKDLTFSESKLGNENFVSRAPKEIVEAEKKKVEEIRTQIRVVEQNLEALAESGDK